MSDVARRHAQAQVKPVLANLEAAHILLLDTNALLMMLDVQSDAWPEVARRMQDIARTMKLMELTMAGVIHE